MSQTILRSDLAQVIVLDVFQRYAIFARFFFNQFFADFNGALALVDVEPVFDFVASSRGLDHAKPVAAGLVSCLSDDLNDVSAVQFVAERDHAAVYLGADTGVADFGVDCVGKINGRAFAR